MKNLKYFPFERNRYFYGKLLTVDDFETEQKYVNDKRRMLNRFLYGSGVVSGMNVVQVDDTSISVEMGLALDFSGREIVVDTPVIKKLSMIEGFDSDSEEQQTGGYLYLCIEYAENEKDAVHSITSANARATDDVEYNKYKESYRMFLTTAEPENEGFTTEHFYKDTKTLYWGNGLRIKQSIPKYVKSGEDLELKIFVENMGQQQSFGFDCDLELTCLQYEGENSLKLHFNEKDFKKAGKYELTYRLGTMAVKDTQGFISVKPGTFRLDIGEKQVSAEVNSTGTCLIVDRNPKKELMTRYYKTAMEEIVKNTYQQSIYLAKIGIIKAGNTYVIDGIETMPFRQFVFNNALASAVNDLQLFELETLKEGLLGAGGQGESGKGHYGFSGSAHTVATGTVTLDLGIGGREGQRFYSEDIAHGLGLGPVYIKLGQAYSTSDDSDLIFGNPEVFEEVADTAVANVELGAKANITKGTFIIGARTVTATNARKVKVDWMAIRDEKESISALESKKLLIKPDMKDINVRESCYFEAVFSNVTDTRVKWSVKEAFGGTIDANGMYTAPNVPGVYEVLAVSPAHPELSASTYVVVREVKEEKR